MPIRKKRKYEVIRMLSHSQYGQISEQHVAEDTSTQFLFISLKRYTNLFMLNHICKYGLFYNAYFLLLCIPHHNVVQYEAYFIIV